MCAPSPPKPPDPIKQAGAQTSSNVSTAIANAALGNVNEYSPEGSIVRKQTGTQTVWDENLKKNITVPTYSSYSQDSAANAAIRASQEANKLGTNAVAGMMIDQLGNAVSTPINYGALPKAGSTANINLPQYTQFGGGPQLKTDLAGADSFSADRQKYEDALMARMNPQLQQERDILNQQALNQGLMPGSQAYDRMIDQQTRQENDARYGAILNAGTEQQRMFDMDRTAQGFFNDATQNMYNNQFRATGANNQLQDQTYNAQNTLFGQQNIERQNALAEQVNEVNRPIQNIQALMGTGSIAPVPYAGANMPQLANVDYAGLMQQQYQNQYQNYGAEAANRNNLIGGAGSLFTSIIGACDIRLKKNIVPAGVVDGHNIYEFDYIDPQDGVGRSVGVMAQEVMQTRPDAVLRRADGMLMVDYGKLFGGSDG